MRIQCLSRGLIESVHRPRKKRDEQEVVDMQHIEHRHQRKDEDERRSYELAGDDESALVEHVREGRHRTGFRAIAGSAFTAAT